MSRTFSQVPALRRFARAYRHVLALSVPAALAACQGATDALAPEQADAPETAAAPSSELTALVGANRIAYVVQTKAGSTDIWSTNPNRGISKQLTSFTGKEDSPSWSFDHSRIAFTRLRNGLPDIYLMNADGTGKRWARSTPYSGLIDQPSWSPDGSHLLVRVYSQNWYLAKLDLATGNLVLVAPSRALAVRGSFPIYDQTGTYIYYRDDVTNRAIKRFKPGGEETTVLTSTWSLGDLAISPDGKKLAYAAAVNDNNWEIFMQDLATKVTTRRTFTDGTDARPTWSPDGTKLAFSSVRTGKWQIHIMFLTGGGGVLPLTNTPYGAYGPAWVR